MEDESKSGLPGGWLFDEAEGWKSRVVAINCVPCSRLGLVQTVDVGGPQRESVVADEESGDVDAGKSEAGC